MLCVDILKVNNKISNEEWNFFLRGAAGVITQRPPKPNIPWLGQTQWETAFDLEALLPAFKGLCKELIATPCWVKFGDMRVNISIYLFFLFAK